MQYKLEREALMENIIIALILIAIVGGAIYYIWKAKKRGQKCIGCPNSGCAKCNCKKD